MDKETSSRWQVLITEIRRLSEQIEDLKAKRIILLDEFRDIEPFVEPKYPMRITTK